MHSTEITELLIAARSGDAQPLTAVFEVLYPELRRLAASRMAGGHSTLTPTALVHELYLRMASGPGLSLTDRRHFFATAAQAMRWVLADYARRGMAGKRDGGGMRLVEVDLAQAGDPATDIEALNRGLDALDQLSPQRRQVVELRYFAGLGFKEIGELLGCSERTVFREWERARAFLHSLLSEA